MRPRARSTQTAVPVVWAGKQYPSMVAARREHPDASPAKIRKAAAEQLQASSDFENAPMTRWFRAQQALLGEPDQP